VRRWLIWHSTTLMLLAVLLLFATGMMLLRPLDTSPLPPIEGTVQLPPGLPDSIPITRIANHLTQIIERPLFTQLRRNVQISAAKPQISLTPPAAAPQSSPPPPPLSVDNLVLKGIYFDPTAARALIASPSHPAGVWMGTGALIEGWEIRLISSQIVGLVQGENTAELKLYPAPPVRFGKTTLP
jgi:hypothetical protein